MPDCRTVTEQLLALRDGSLPPGDTAALREHFHLCPPCLDLFRTYSEAVDLLARLMPRRMPDGLLERLRARLG
jgi:anti-sigma factor RsiW